MQDWKPEAQIRPLLLTYYALLMYSFLNVFSRKAVKVDKVVNWCVACLWEHKVLGFGLLLQEFLKAVSRWHVVLYEHKTKFVAEHYGGGFGQGISHKTVKAQLSNTQISGTFL